MAYDILIKGGRVFDGEGNKPIEADLGVSGDEIADIGNLDGKNALKVIDASGHYVTPGFVDITNHSDTHLCILKYPLLESMAFQGVTTIIGGNCGSSLAPLASPAAINAVAKWSDLSDVNVNWNTVAEFLSTIDGVHVGLNFGMLVGYGTILRSVVGDNARALDAAETDSARLLLEQGLSEGAFGLSLGLAYGHEASATTEEIIAVAHAFREHPGIIKLHLRSEGKKLFAATNEAVQIARNVRVPVQISHLKAIGAAAWSEFEKAINLITSTRSSGVDISFDTSAYSSTGSPLYLLLPDWAREGGFRKLFERISKPEERSRIIEDLKLSTLHFDRLLVISAKVRTVVGRTIAEIAKEAGVGGEEALLETITANEGRVTTVGLTVSKENTRRAVLDQNALIASDGEGYPESAVDSGNLMHPRSFGNFPLFWRRYVREQQLIQPEDAIRKMTSGPAKKIGIKNRGTLKKGMKADIIVFAPDTFADRATYRNPYRYAQGLLWSIINGKLTIENGAHTGERNGKVLRRN